MGALTTICNYLDKGQPAYCRIEITASTISSAFSPDCGPPNSVALTVLSNSQGDESLESKVLYNVSCDGMASLPAFDLIKLVKRFISLLENLPTVVLKSPKLSVEKKGLLVLVRFMTILVLFRP